MHVTMPESALIANSISDKTMHSCMFTQWHHWHSIDQANVRPAVIVMPYCYATLQRQVLSYQLLAWLDRIHAQELKRRHREVMQDLLMDVLRAFILAH